MQVIQPPSGGLVRGIALSPPVALPRGSTVLSSGNQSETPVNLHELGQILPQLAGPSPITTGAARLLETGIKVIDVMCPLVAGGNAIIAGELCNPTYTLYELTHRLKDGPDAHVRKSIGSHSALSRSPATWNHGGPGWSP